MSKPDPSITADLLNSLPTKKADLNKDTQAGKTGHATQKGPAPHAAKVSSRSAEKASVQGHTRSSNRGK